MIAQDSKNEVIEPHFADGDFFSLQPTLEDLQSLRALVCKLTVDLPDESQAR